MNVLITGANGQLGGVLARLAPNWAEINTIDIDDCDFIDVPMLRARLTVEAPDVIINAAAYTDVDKAESEEGLARAINAEAVRVMVEAMAETGGKLVHVSCDAVFDGASAQAYRPEDHRNPLSVYGRTKAEGEDCLRANDLLVRTAWLYEVGGANFVRTALRLMKEREVLEIAADQIGSPTWASDSASAIWGLVERQATGTFHHSDEGVVSLYDFATAIAYEAHNLGLVANIPEVRRIAAADSTAAAERPAFSPLDSSATRAVLGDVPVSWRTNLRVMLAEEAKAN